MRVFIGYKPPTEGDTSNLPYFTKVIVENILESFEPELDLDELPEMDYDLLIKNFEKNKRVK
jgi:ribosomal protein S17E